MKMQGVESMYADLFIKHYIILCSPEVGKMKFALFS